MRLSKTILLYNQRLKRTSLQFGALEKLIASPFSRQTVIRLGKQVVQVRLIRVGLALYPRAVRPVGSGVELPIRRMGISRTGILRERR